MQNQYRVQGLQEAMKIANVDMVAIGPTVNMRYLLGYAPFPDERLCLLLLTPSSASILTPKLNAGDFAARTEIQCHMWADDQDPHHVLTSALPTTPIRKLAIDGSMRADFLLPLLTAAAPQETISAEPLLATLRLRKSAEEVDALANAARQADLAMQAAIDACVPGATEAQVAWAAEAAFRVDGAEQVTFIQIASGPNGANPHHLFNQRQLQPGEAIVVDLAAVMNGYQSDICRMVYLGDPPAAFLQAYQGVLSANERARAAVQPGVTAQAIDQIARSTLEAAGYGDHFIHRTGHGLGIEVHEPPYIRPGNNEILQEGMVFSIEPGVYFPGEFGIRIEDIVVVTAAGVHTLTGSSHQLVVK